MGEEGEGDKDCVRAGEDLTPYKKYKSYKRWERRPLFVIIIGGLRWDYLIPDDTDYESQAHTQNPKLKAFNWIKRHGTTMKQVVPVFPPFDLPTWTSLATGLYPQNTGVVGDYMYNLQNKEMSTGTMTWPASMVGGLRGSPSGLWQPSTVGR